jgi:TRAP-type C4-dicarboxylate transport system permease small subunit
MLGSAPSVPTNERGQPKNDFGPTLAVFRQLSQKTSWISGALLLGAAFLIGLDIVTRNLLDFSVPGTDELAGYALAIAGSWALAFAMLSRTHIRVDTLYILMPIRVRCVLDLVGVLSIIVFFSLIALHSYRTLEQSFVSGSRSQSELEVLLAVPQSVWVAGFIFFVITAAVLFSVGVIQFVRKDYRSIQELIGAKTIEEEVAEEAISLNRALPDKV